MRASGSPCACALLVATGLWARQRTVAITVDDLPYVGAAEPSKARMVNDWLLAAFRGRHVPVTGFVAKFLAGRGYRLATCTIDNSDYLFNATYVQMLAAKERQVKVDGRLEPDPPQWILDYGKPREKR